VVGAARAGSGVAAGAEDDIVDVVGGDGAGRAGPPRVHLDVPVGRAVDRRGDVLDPDVGVGVERPAGDVGVDRHSHRLEIVAHHQQHATGGHRVEQVLHAAAVGRAGD